MERWRQRARDIGVGELFILCTNAFGFSAYRDAGFDGLVEFPPHALTQGDITETVERLNPDFGGRIYDYGAIVEGRIAALGQRQDARVFPGVMPSWDNEARKPGFSNIFHGATPQRFHAWSSAALDCSMRLAPPDERLVFVNAWNEWGEGAYLEPDRWYGHASAQALRRAVADLAPATALQHPAVLASRDLPRAHDAVILFHIYYPDLIEDLAARLAPLRDSLDVIVTFPDQWPDETVEALARAVPGAARAAPRPISGRDVAPFLTALEIARGRGYTVSLQGLTARSRRTGPTSAAWRDRLLDGLMSPGARPQGLGSVRARPPAGPAGRRRHSRQLRPSRNYDPERRRRGLSLPDGWAFVTARHPLSQAGIEALGPHHGLPGSGGAGRTGPAVQSGAGPGRWHAGPRLRARHGRAGAVSRLPRRLGSWCL